MDILQSTVFSNVKERLERDVRWEYFEDINIRFIKNHMQL